MACETNPIAKLLCAFHLVPDCGCDGPKVSSNGNFRSFEKGVEQMSNQLPAFWPGKTILQSQQVQTVSAQSPIVAPVHIQNAPEGAPFSFVTFDLSDPRLDTGLPIPMTGKGLLYLRETSESDGIIDVQIVGGEIPDFRPGHKFRANFGALTVKRNSDSALTGIVRLCVFKTNDADYSEPVAATAATSPEELWRYRFSGDVPGDLELFNSTNSSWYLTTDSNGDYIWTADANRADVTPIDVSRFHSIVVVGSGNHSANRSWGLAPVLGPESSSPGLGFSANYLNSGGGAFTKSLRYQLNGIGSGVSTAGFEVYAFPAAYVKLYTTTTNLASLSAGQTCEIAYYGIPK